MILYSPSMQCIRGTSLKKKYSYETMPLQAICYSMQTGSSRKNRAITEPFFISIIEEDAGLSHRCYSALAFDFSNMRTGTNTYEDNLRLRHFCKSGAIHKACSLFASMISRDVYTWNTIMSAYVRLEHGAEVINLYNRLLQESVLPNTFIFASMVSACTTHVDMLPGKHIHACIQGSEDIISDDVVVQTSLVNFYGRFGELHTSRHVFYANPCSDVGLWNGLLTVNEQHRQDDDCWTIYNQMQQHGVMQNKITFIIMLSVCSSEAACTNGKKLHACIYATGFQLDIVVGTALVNMYSKCMRLGNAQEMFSVMPQKDLILWNAMLAGYALNGKCYEALQLYNQMHQEAIFPNEATVTSLIDATLSSNNVLTGNIIHAQVVAMRLETDIITGAALINMYGKSRGVYEAHQYFKGIKYHDSTSWNTLISAFVKHGKHTRALQLYYEMRREGVVPDEVTFVSILSTFGSEVEIDEGRRVHTHATCIGLDINTAVGNALISMYDKCGTWQDVDTTFKMIRCHDVVTYVNMISASTSNAMLSEGKQMHSRIDSRDIECNVILANVIINMYGKCGDLYNARDIFKKMHERNVITWTTIIAAYAQHGDGREALLLYLQMLRMGIIPESITFVILLFACSHAGMLKDAYEILASLSTGYQFLSLDHLNCLVDLLGRSGCLDCAENVITSIPFQPSSLSWSMLLCTCHNHFDLKRGEFAGSKLMELNPNDTSGYVLLSNMYGAVDSEIY